MLSAAGCLADTHCAADFLGNHHPAEVVDSSYNSCRFHILNLSLFRNFEPFLQPKAIIGVF